MIIFRVMIFFDWNLLYIYIIVSCLIMTVIRFLYNFYFFKLNMIVLLPLFHAKKYSQ